MTQRRRIHPLRRAVMRGITAFTLIEVLVVVAIIALLVAVLLPSLSRARDQARCTVCITHERQMGEAMNLFATEYRGRVPRGLSQHPGTGNLQRPPNWIRMIARMFGDKRDYAENFNRVPVEKYEVYSCPARSAEYGGHFLDYVVNSTDSRGPMTLSPCRSTPVGGSWYEVEGTTKIDKWKRPTQVAYVMEAVEESWEIDNAGRSFNTIRKNIAAIRAQVDPNITITGFDWFDVPGGYSLPTYYKFTYKGASATQRYPRASLKMHLGLGSNAVFADSHVEMLKPPPESAGAAAVYRYFMLKMGVDPKVVPLVDPNTLSADAAVDPCTQGDTTWRPGVN